MPNTIPVAKGLECPECGRNSMKVRLLDRMVGRTGFVVQNCRECGYLHSYTIEVPRPWWHFGAAGIVGALSLLLLVWKLWA